MANPIISSTNTFLSEFSLGHPDVIASTETDIAGWTRAHFAEQLNTEQMIHLLKAIKYVASTDGLSTEESTGLTQVMLWMGVPEAIRTHVEAFEVAGLSLDDVAEVCPRGSLKAKQLIDSAITLAMLDEFSDRERNAVIELAAKMGLRAEVVTAYEARIRLGNLLRGVSNEAIQEARVAMRNALWALS